MTYKAYVAETVAGDYQVLFYRAGRLADYATYRDEYVANLKARQWQWQNVKEAA